MQVKEKGLLPSKLDVYTTFGISRSFRRGSVTAARNHAPNDKCNEQDIKRNNRWRTEDRADMINTGLDMLHLVEADLKFSSCL